MPSARRLVYFVASSVDGFIAAPDGGTDHFPLDPGVVDVLCTRYPETLPGHVRTPMGIEAPNRAFDTVVMGRGTYEPALALGITSPYPHLRQYVVSRTLTATTPDVEIVPDGPVGLVRRLKQEEGLDIWLAGGGDLAGQLLPEVDELVLKLNPFVAGAGIPLASAAFAPVHLTLVSAEPLPGGVVVLRWTRQAPTDPAPVPE